jgi:thioesterase domain-containing protein/acyl transferase domain-containing protein
VRLNAPSIPFISNLTGTWVDAQTLTDPTYWVRHLREPVRFADGLRQALELPDAILLEAGPGQGLCALARQNSAGKPRVILPSTCKAQEPHTDVALMLTSAGALWAHGKQLDWQAVRGAAPRQRIPLPTYAFDHQRHWVEPGVRPQEQATQLAPAEQVAAQPHAIKRLPSLDDWYRTPEWRPVPLPVVPSPSARKWLVFGNESELTAAVLAQLTQQGSSVTLVRRGDAFAKFADGSFSIAAGEPAQYVQLLDALEASDALPDHIVHLWPLDTMPGAAAGQLAGQTLSFDSLVATAKALSGLDCTEPIRLTVVTAGSHSTQGEAVPHPERALALGPCRVIPRELPNVSARVVDLDPSDVSSEAVARAIVAEASHADSADLIAYRGGQRWLPELAALPAPAADAQLRVRGGGVYLITGGLGDIALDLAGWLAKTAKVRLALVSRRALPPKASWRGLAASGAHSPEVRLVRRLVALEEQGAHVLAFSADVSDRAAMARVVSACRARYGTIHGVFHTAGALADGPIATKTAQSIQQVLSAKACGAQVLHELLPPGDLDLFAVFSSTSVYLGPAGQVDYVAANAYLDALAASRSDGLSIHWGIWGDKGLAGRAASHAEVGHEALRNLHPLLGSQVDSDNGAAFEARYATKDLWVLQEHAVAGQSVLPGTAYIEIARAAMMVLHPQAAIEIRSLSFEEPMVFDGASARLVRVEMRRTGASYDFSVRSRGELDERWLEHARAGVSVFLGSLPAAPAVRDAREWRPGAIPQDRAVAFGARWRNIARMRLADRSAVAQIELPQKFASDLVRFGAHPALTDMAATFGLHLVDAAERASNLFVPLSVARIRLVAPVPAKVISRVELKDPPRERFAAFDVSLHTPDGSPIATFEGFSLRAVKPDVVSHQAAPAREPTLLDSMLACGIRSEDSHDLFARIFSGTVRDLVVSSIEIADLRRAIAHNTVKPVRRKAASPAEGDADLNPVEQAIADAWRELLGVEEVAANDDFFALGGHSLAAVRLFARIRKQYAVDLPLATLFQAPTLRALSALVAQTGGLNTNTNADAPKKAGSNVIPLVTRSWSPLVAICRGRADRRPLFCVHGAGGNVLNFKVISDRLGQDQPFYGLQAQGVDGRLAPLSSIEEMAAQYVESIRTVDAQGPYRLAGYSAGGVIALEMAQRLKKDGAVVELLAMIDTLSPSAARRKVSYFTKLWMMRHWSLKFALDWPARRRRGKLAEATYAQALERVRRGEALPPELVEFHLFRNFLAAQSRYYPETYQGSMALFKASQADTQYLGAGNSLGWDEHVRGEIRVTEIGGSHFTMMAEPGVSELIEAFKKELARLDEHPQHPHTRAA